MSFDAGPAGQLPQETRFREDRRAQGQGWGRAGLGALRRPGAPRSAPALGPAPRARGHAQVLGAAARDPRPPRREPAGRAYRGSPAGVPRVRGRHPQGRVRRRDDARVRSRHLRGREVPPQRGDRHLRRRAATRSLRAVSDPRAGLDDPPDGPAARPRLRADAPAADARCWPEAATSRPTRRHGPSRSSGTASGRCCSAITATSSCWAATEPTSPRATPRCASWRGRWARAG